MCLVPPDPAFAMIQLAEGVRPKMADADFRKEIEASFTELVDKVNKTVDPHEKLAL